MIGMAVSQRPSVRMLLVMALGGTILGAMLAQTVGSPDDMGAAKKSRCPNGTARFVHVCIEKTAHEPVNLFESASAACFNRGGRLPTSAELDAFRQRSGITLANPEWTTDFLDDGEALAMNDEGDYEGRFLDVTTAFRCVF